MLARLSTQKNKRPTLLQPTVIEILCLVGVGVILSFGSLAIVSFIIVLYIIARLLPLTSFGLLGRLPVAYILFVCFISFLGIIGWIFSIPLTISSTLVVLYTLLLLIFLVFAVGKSDLLKRPKIFTKNDIVSSVVGIASFLFILSPVLPKPTAFLLAPVVIAGGDNSTHLEIIKTNDFNQGYSLGLSNRFDMPSNMYSYPQGWHLNGAVIKWLIDPFINIADSPGKTLGFFLAYSAGWFALLVTLMTRIALLLSQARKKTESRIGQWSFISVVGISLAGGASWLLPLFNSGFQPQIASLVLFLVEILFLIEAYRQPIESRYRYLLLAVIAGACTSLVWIYMLPVAAICVALFVLHTLARSKIWPSIYSLAVAYLAILGATFQLYIQLLYPESGGGFAAYGYMPYSFGIYFLVALLGLASIMIFLYKPFAHLKPILSIAAIVTLFAVVIMIIQLVSYNELRYYYYKALPAIIVVLIIIFSALTARTLAHFLEINAKSVYKTGGIIIFSIALMVTFFMGVKSLDFDSYFNKKVAGISKEQTVVLVDVVDRDPINGIRFAPIGSCDRGEDIRASLLARALTYTKQIYKEPAIVLSLGTSSRQLIYEQFDYFLKTYQKDVYVISRNKALNQGLLDYVGDNKKFVHITDGDPDPPATLLANCPDRLGSRP